MIFKKLDLIGFKSFIDKTTIIIEKGLTGIVGPNGCGKSNIVEAIRWCMGETSAKSMRGSGMEDVIFSGTANKTSKNIAEVSLTLDNADKDGPFQFKELDIVNVKRRIEKDKGSRYFINDKEMRARDIHTLFADLSTGAHSPSMISQGRIGALVTAKPTDRKAILEEAAGISGIHVRRHESELRLNSAENNLKKADDLRRQQEKQLENLKKQAIEASKYKLILEEIKKVEAGLYYIRLIEIDKEIQSTKEITGKSDSEISNLTTEIEKKNDLVCIIRRKSEDNDSIKKILENTILKENKNLVNLFKGDLKSWPIYTSGKPIKSIYKKVLYIGDAFYTFPPTMAQGASQSIEAANEIFDLISNNHSDIQNEYFKNRVKRTNLINKRSKFNYFGFHISNPLLKILRNEFLKRLVKNKNFIHSYLGKVYK